MKIQVYLWRAFKVHPGNRKSGDVHGNTAVQIKRAHDEKEPSANNGPAHKLKQEKMGVTSSERNSNAKLIQRQSHRVPVLQQNPLYQPQRHQQQTVDLTDGEGPIYPVKKVKELVRKRRGVLFRRYSLVDH